MRLSADKQRKKLVNIVMRTSQSMHLENQKNSDKRLEAAIREKTYILMKLCEDDCGIKKSYIAFLSSVKHLF